jgi:hypothetical protein
MALLNLRLDVVAFASILCCIRNTAQVFDGKIVLDYLCHVCRVGVRYRRLPREARHPQRLCCLFNRRVLALLVADFCGTRMRPLVSRVVRTSVLKLDRCSSHSQSFPHARAQIASLWLATQPSRTGAQDGCLASISTRMRVMVGPNVSVFTL